MLLLLSIIAIALFIYGLVLCFRGEPVLGIVLIIAAFLVGPGGYSIFK